MRTLPELSRLTRSRLLKCCTGAAVRPERATSRGGIVLTRRKDSAYHYKLPERSNVSAIEHFFLRWLATQPPSCTGSLYVKHFEGCRQRNPFKPRGDLVILSEASQGCDRHKWSARRERRAIAKSFNCNAPKNIKCFIH